ncbi:MAG: hypothetical protein ACI808_002149 [Paraglaciecola sp.]|jgi:hypothetical protein
MHKNIKAMLFGLVASASFSSQASLYEFEDLNASNGSAHGMTDQLESVGTTFNTTSNQFTWDVEFNSNSSGVDGFWLVISNGSNPKSSDVNELAIIYGDMDTGILTTYAYNGLNSASSYLNPGILLQTDTFTSDSDGFSIDIDVSGINGWVSPDPDYTGVHYEDTLGIWFHVSQGSNFVYGQDGVLEEYSFDSAGFYDHAFLTADDITDISTATVPEPGAFALMLCGLVGLRLYKKRK